MGKAVLTPTTPEDVLEFKQRTPPYRIKALTGRVDGRIVGIGGIAYLPDGTLVAFLEATDEARKHAVTLYKAAKQILQDAAASGHRKIVAIGDPEIDAVPRWLKHLGFEPVDNGIYVKHGRP